MSCFDIFSFDSASFGWTEERTARRAMEATARFDGTLNCFWLDVLADLMDNDGRENVDPTQTQRKSTQQEKEKKKKKARDESKQNEK